MKKTVLLSILALLMLIGAPAASLAQTSAPTKLKVPSTPPPAGLNLNLSPTYISLVTDPGKKVSSQFKVTNNNSFTEYLRVRVAKIEVSSNGKPILADMKASDEFAKWIDVPEKEFAIGGNQSKVVNFTIDPPASAGLGYYYTLLIGRINSSQENGQAAIAGAAGITVLLDVRSPNAKRELQVTDFKTSSAFYEYLPATLELTVKNTGNVHVVPFGDIFIDSMFNKEIAVLPANPGRNNVLPQSQRTFTGVWDDGFAVRAPKMKDGVVVKDSKGRVEYETKYDFTKANKFRFGKYTAHLLMVYDNGERDIPVEATVSFWVIPWKIVGIAGIILILALVGLTNTIFSYGKRLSRRSDRR